MFRKYEGCRLMNLPGTLLLAWCCVCGMSSTTLAEEYGSNMSGNGDTASNANLVLDSGTNGVFGGYSYYTSLQATQGSTNIAVNNAVTINVGNYTFYMIPLQDAIAKEYNIAVAGGFANQVANSNTVTINAGSFNGGEIYGGFASDVNGFNTANSTSNARTDANSIYVHSGVQGNVDLIVGGYIFSENGAPATIEYSVAEDNKVILDSPNLVVNGKNFNLGTDAGQYQIAVAGGLSTEDANKNSVSISAGTFNGIIVGGASLLSQSGIHTNSVTVTGGTFNPEPLLNSAIYGSYLYSSKTHYNQSGEYLGNSES